MSASRSSDQGPLDFWKTYVVPTSKTLRAVSWELLWCLVILCAMTSFNPFLYFLGDVQHESRNATPAGGQAVPEQPAAE